MKFIVNDSIFESYPGLVIGVITAKGIDNKGNYPEIMSKIKEQSNNIMETFEKETLCENPKFGVWRETYSSFGAKPKKYKCSVENLYRMILDNIELNHINKIVDIYNLISIKHIVPAGGDDLDRVEGDIVLTKAEGNEKFIRLNSDEVEPPSQGEVVYRDDKEVLCRRWNWRECDKTKMTQETRNVSIVFEFMNEFRKEEINEILNEAKNLIKEYCGGELHYHIIDKDNRSCAL